MADGAACFGSQDPLYLDYHDHEWGRPVRDERGIYERICLEGFQSGLSWLTILRKRVAFREAFADFDPELVAGFGTAEIDRLLADERIVRHRGKIEAAIANARATLSLRRAGTPLHEVFWEHMPRATRVPRSHADWTPSSPESELLSRRLRREGFRFVGPTTLYAAMQACGVVNDHLAGCPVRAELERATAV